MKKGFVLLLFVAGMGCMLLQSCAKRPFACFSTDVEIDSIRVNEPVVFSAYCSDNTSEYFWEFYDGDSVEFGPVVTQTFKDTGQTEVKLLTTNGTKTSAYSQTFVVRP